MVDYQVATRRRLVDPCCGFIAHLRAGCSYDVQLSTLQLVSCHSTGIYYLQADLITRAATWLTKPLQPYLAQWSGITRSNAKPCHNHSNRSSSFCCYLCQFQGGLGNLIAPSVHLTQGAVVPQDKHSPHIKYPQINMIGARSHLEPKQVGRALLSAGNEPAVYRA